MATRPAGDVAAFCKKYPVLLPQTLLRNVQMFSRPVLLNIMWKTGGSVFINTTRNVHLSHQNSAGKCLIWIRFVAGNVPAACQRFLNISQPTQLENVWTSPQKHPVVSGLWMQKHCLNSGLWLAMYLTIINPSTLKSSYKHVRLIRHVLQDYTCKTQLNFVFRTN